MEYKDAKGDKEPLLRINTQKHKVVPLKNTKEANVFAISMGKKSKIKAKIKCDGCQALLNRTEMKKCYSCSKNICPDCSRKKQGKNYCSECL